MKERKKPDIQCIFDDIPSRRQTDLASRKFLNRNKPSPKERARVE
jgi:hypothetical protein